MEEVLVYRLANVDDIEDISLLEAQSFPEDEMASKETITNRQKEAGSYMLVVRNLKDNNNLIGFVNGTLTTKTEIHHESMSCHEPNGQTLVIHSVTINHKFRRNGMGTKMLLYYINKIINDQKEVKKILLLTKEYLVKFYQSTGFEVIKLSDVEHGLDKWYEMSMTINR